MTILLALGSSLLWGVADFLGGKTSRHRLTVMVVLISQVAGFASIAAVALVTESFSAPTGYLPWAVGAGLAGASAVVLFYHGLAIGTMGVVAPIAALGVVIPVLIGMAKGAMPSAVCIAGIVLAIVGVVVTSRPAESGPRADQHALSVICAVGAAIGFGFLQYAISGGAAHSTVMTLLSCDVLRCRCSPPPLC